MPEEDAQEFATSETDDDKHTGGTLKSWMLETCSQISHAEITERLAGGGHIKAAIIEAQDDNAAPRYAVFLLASWRSSYHVLRVHWPARPRFFRDLGRLMAQLRQMYGFKGPVALTTAFPNAEDAPRLVWRPGISGNNPE